MNGVPGGGLAKGLAVTLKTMTHRSHTRQFPDTLPDLPPRSRGVIALVEENCRSFAAGKPLTAKFAKKGRQGRKEQQSFAVCFANFAALLCELCG